MTSMKRAPAAKEKAKLKVLAAKEKAKLKVPAAKEKAKLKAPVAKEKAKPRALAAKAGVVVIRKAPLKVAVVATRQKKKVVAAGNDASRSRTSRSGLSQSKVAAKLGVSLPTVKRHWNRASLE